MHLNFVKCDFYFEWPSLASTIAFIAPWFAFVKQMKLRWRGVFPHLESDFQPGLLCGAFLTLQLLNLNSRQFNQLVARTDSRPTWKQLDAMVNALLSRRGAQENHSPSTGVFHNLENSKMQFFRYSLLKVLLVISWRLHLEQCGLRHSIGNLMNFPNVPNFPFTQFFW